MLESVELLLWLIDICIDASYYATTRKGLGSTSKKITADLLSAFPPGGPDYPDNLLYTTARKDHQPVLSKSSFAETARCLNDAMKKRTLRVIIAASVADGLIHPDEDDLLHRLSERLDHDQKIALASEISNPWKISDLAWGVDDHGDKVFLFTVALLALRADGDICEEEKQFIRELADALGLSYTEAKLIISAGLSPSSV